MDSQLRQLTHQRQHAHRLLQSLGSPVYAAFLKLERATYAEGQLSTMVKELMAVAIGVVIHCQSCMQWHIQQAAAAGATLRQVLEAVEVGMEMGGGPATVSARFALAVMAEVFGPEAMAQAAGQQG